MTVLSFIWSFVLPLCLSLQNNTIDSSSSPDKLSDHCNLVVSLCNKMEKEADAFYKIYAESYGQKLPTSVVCLSNALNYAYRIRDSIKEIQKGNRVYENLQSIDMNCNGINDKCIRGCEELDKYGNQYLTPAGISSWKQVLDRIKKYSKQIQGELESIRDAL